MQATDIDRSLCKLFKNVKLINFTPIAAEQINRHFNAYDNPEPVFHIRSRTSAVQGGNDQQTHIEYEVFNIYIEKCVR